jgi:hypothetical protein
MTKSKAGRPKTEPTAVITIPVHMIKIVERIVGKPIAENQCPTVRVRVPVDLVDKIKSRIAKGK